MPKKKNKTIGRISRGGQGVKRHPITKPIFDLNVPLVAILKSSSLMEVSGKRDNTSSSVLQLERRQKQANILQRLYSTGYSVVAVSHTIYGKMDIQRDAAHTAIPTSLVTKPSSPSPTTKMAPKDTTKPSNIGDSVNSSSKAGETNETQRGMKRKASDLYSSPGKVHSNSQQTKEHFQVLRRLNVVIEQVSDLAYYTYTPVTDALIETISSIKSSSSISPKGSLPSTNRGNLTPQDNTNPSSQEQQKHSERHQFLQEYDLIAMIPKNDTVFTAICTTSHLLVDIIVLDYTAGRGGIQLPYKLKTSDIASAVSRGVHFELTYGPALLDTAKRKAFVQAAIQFRTACVGIRVSKQIKLSSKKCHHNRHPCQMILSSGERTATVTPTSTTTPGDFGPMALRMPGDLLNFCKVVLGFDDKIVRCIMTDHPQDAVALGSERKRFLQRKYTVGTNRMKYIGYPLKVEVTLEPETEVTSLKESIHSSAPFIGEMRKRIHNQIAIVNKTANNCNAESDNDSGTSSLILREKDEWHTKRNNHDKQDEIDEGFLQLA